MSSIARAAPRAAAHEIFLVFLEIGAVSFGGGVVAYLRNALVERKQWFDDVEFLELTSISNVLPGLNSTNMAILAGDRLGGTAGAVAAMVGMCLPAFILMTAAGIAYGSHVERHNVDAALRGVAAAATGLIAATWYQIGKKSMKGFYDALFVVLAIVGVNHFKWPVPVVLVGVGALAIYTYRPRTKVSHAPEESEAWIKSLH